MKATTPITTNATEYTSKTLTIILRGSWRGPPTAVGLLPLLGPRTVCEMPAAVIMLVALYESFTAPYLWMIDPGNDYIARA